MEKIKVLVVDDATFMRDMVKKGLRSAWPGFHIDEAINGKQAMGMLGKASYDLILCDWEMPEMSGAELLQWLRANPSTADMPFVMVTSRGDKENVAQAITLKVNNYIVKPYTNEKLVSVVTTVLTRAKGISAEQLKAQGGAAAGGVRDIGLSGALPIAATITAPPPPAPPRTHAPAIVKPRERVLLPMRFSNDATSCLIRELSRERLTGVIRRSDKVPRILDLVVIDIAHEGQTGRLNGFVYALQARDDSSESEFINITVTLVDQEDAEKMSLLERYMASIA